MCDLKMFQYLILKEVFELGELDEADTWLKGWT